MGRLETTRKQAKLRKQRVRARIFGTGKKPRLSVNISNRHIIAQLIDDSSSTTLVYVSSISNKAYDKQNLTEKARNVGSDLGKAATAKKIKTAVLDRGMLKYHGRIKGLTDAARQSGLEI